MKKINKKNIVAGALGVTMITFGAVGAVYASPNGSSNSPREMGQQQGGGHMQVAADMMGVSVGDLESRIQNGENIRDMLEADGITKEDMRAAHMSNKQERMDKAVKSGNMTQEQADEKRTQMAERQSSREGMHLAVENGDYDAWSAAVLGTKAEGKVTAESFASLVEAYGLREAGDHEAAKAIMQELGFDKGGMHGGKKGGHNKMHK